ncbi:uncharacterized protein [Musca autumnalis]|uniref:uncharacterized protein n=1 Tax=Musca autumnalis TaxID=221902 RepID=UPI003CEEC746
MSKSDGKSTNLYPTAPPETLVDNDPTYQRGPPPPSYEEALKMSSHSQAQYYQQPPTHQQFPIYQPNAGYVNPYPAHIQQHQNYYNTAAPPPTHVNQMSPSHNVLHFDKRAEIRTTANGAVTVPPPPPGIAPTPAQLAAMSGQPVMIKKKKNSFF